MKPLADPWCSVRASGMDWVAANWLGLGTAVVGVWVSWRLRAHPAIRYRFDRVSVGSIFLSRSAETKIRIQNTGTEAISQDAVRRELSLIFSAPCRSAVPVAASNHDIRPSAEVDEVLPEMVRLRFIGLEPGDTVLYRIKHEMGRAKPSLEGSIHGNRTAIRPSTNPIEFLVHLVLALFFSLPELLTVLWTLELWSDGSRALSLVYACLSLAILVGPMVVLRLWGRRGRIRGDQDRADGISTLGQLAGLVVMGGFVPAVLGATLLGLEWYLPEVMVAGLVIASAQEIGSKVPVAQYSRLIAYLPIVLSVLMAIAIFAAWPPGVVLLLAGGYLLVRAGLPKTQGSSMVDLSEQLVYESLSDKDRRLLIGAPVLVAVAVAGADGKLSEAERSALEDELRSDRPLDPLLDIVRTELAPDLIEHLVGEAEGVCVDVAEVVKLLLEADRVLRSEFSDDDAYGFWLNTFMVSAVVSCADEMDDAEAAMMHHLRWETLGVWTPWDAPNQDLGDDDDSIDSQT